MPSSKESESLVNKKYFLKMQSEQYFEKTNQSIFKHYLEIKDNATRDKFFDLCYYLFEEVDTIYDIKKKIYDI